MRQPASGGSRHAGRGVDRLARDVITRGGYGEYFTHRTGHGLGMEAHESPYVFHGNPLILEPGMVFTIEPGIYLPGKYGVRIEDDVVVEEDGLRSLTDLPRRVMRLEEFSGFSKAGAGRKKMTLSIHLAVLGPLGNNVYFLVDDDSGDCVLIDPSFEPQTQLRLACEQGWQLRQIWLTHGHYDHTAGQKR